MEIKGENPINVLNEAHGERQRERRWVRRWRRERSGTGRKEGRAGTDFLFATLWIIHFIPSLSLSLFKRHKDMIQLKGVGELINCQLMFNEVQLCSINTASDPVSCFFYPRSNIKPSPLLPLGSSSFTREGSCMRRCSDEQHLY